MLMNIGNDTGRFRAHFSCKSVRVVLLYRIVVKARGDGVLIEGSHSQPWHKTFPDPKILVSQMHGSSSMLPAIEVTNHRDRMSIGSPEGKIDTCYTVDDAEMGPHFLIDAILFPLSKQVQVEVAQDGI